MATQHEHEHEHNVDLVARILDSLPPLKNNPPVQATISSANPFQFEHKSADPTKDTMVSHFNNMQDQHTAQQSRELIADHDIKSEPRNTAGLSQFPVTTSPPKQGLCYDTMSYGSMKFAQPQAAVGAMDGGFRGLPSLQFHTNRHLRNGPEPAPGTPQALFKDLVLRPSRTALNTGEDPSRYMAAGPRPPVVGPPATLPAIPFGGATTTAPGGALITTVPNPSAHRNRRRGAQDEQSQNPVQRLSSECQKRGFNPQWTITLEKDGRGYHGSVNLAGEMVYNNGIHSTAEKAKSACAVKALTVVTKLPLDKVYWQHRPDKIYTRNSHTLSYTPTYDTKVRVKDEYRERDYKQACYGQEGVTSGRGTGEHDRLLRQISEMAHPDTTVNKYAGAHPDIISAFFEGMALALRMNVEPGHHHRQAEPPRDARREGSGLIESYHRHGFSTPDQFDSSPNHGESRGSSRRHGGRSHDRRARRSSRSRSPRR